MQDLWCLLEQPRKRRKAQRPSADDAELDALRGLHPQNGFGGGSFAASPPAPASAAAAEIELQSLGLASQGASQQLMSQASQDENVARLMEMGYCADKADKVHPTCHEPTLVRGGGKSWPLQLRRLLVPWQADLLRMLDTQAAPYCHGCPTRWQLLTWASMWRRTFHPRCMIAAAGATGVRQLHGNCSGHHRPVRLR